MAPCPVAKHDLYTVLHITRDADFAAIRSAYRQAALTTHPDKGGSAEAFRLVALAFQTLSNESKRASYDRQREYLASKQKQAAEQARRDPTTPQAGKKRKQPTRDFEDNCPTPCAKTRPSESPAAAQARRACTEAFASLRKALQRLEAEGRKIYVDHLPMAVKLALLRYMSSPDAAGPASKGGVSPKKMSSCVAACNGSEADDNAEDSTEDADDDDDDVSTCSDDSEYSHGSPEWLHALEDGCAEGEDYDLSKDISLTALALENASPLAGDDMANESRRRRRLQGLQAGITRGRSQYRAYLHFKGITFYMDHHSLEVSVENHLLCMNFKRKVFELVETLDIDEAIIQAHEDVIKSQGAVLKMYLRIMLPTYLKKGELISPVLPLRDVLNWRSRILDAREKDWNTFREVWRDLLLKKAATHGSKTKWAVDPDTVNAHLDQVWADNKTRWLQWQVRQKLRQARREMLAGREQRKQARLLQREEAAIERATRKAERAMLAFNKVTRGEKEVAQRTVEREAALQRLKRQRLSDARWQWMRRADLTTEEMLRGVPKNLRSAAAT
eukprot:TRINITY_DN22796_c0_g1_i2.p1 TRINITY_DN22796_c0_g1~~TRINITY_DN22796_c0_g1_i2.p1  ORF type:complete len:559 (-),score=93.47 TRINITY_DN22796_c0_g1_i2:340-2016(-)